MALERAAVNKFPPRAGKTQRLFAALWRCFPSLFPHQNSSGKSEIGNKNYELSLRSFRLFLVFMNSESPWRSDSGEARKAILMQNRKQ
jgi:hypothetical protein